MLTFGAVKILVVRFSSIGDIVLTTPVVRCLKKQVPNVELHFLTKESFGVLLEANPYVDRLWTMKKSLSELKTELKAEQFDLIVDLHHNLRTARLKTYLGVKAVAFEKLNLKKWWLVRTKRDLMPKMHIVDRYLKTVEHLGVKADGEPCDFYIDPENELHLGDFQLKEKGFLAVSMGAQFATKVIPEEHLISLLADIPDPIVLLGGKGDFEKAELVKRGLKGQQVHNMCGLFNLQQSAFLCKTAAAILSGDTGLMHIASAFKTPIVSVWGNTVPSLGMYPYAQKDLYSIHEVKDLDCRPCSKIGYQTCPKGHFKCMNGQNYPAIHTDLLNKIST